MKTNILNKLALSGCLLAGLGMMSCEDFLTITPTNQIVEEEFWQDKRDLENVVLACYKRLVSDDVLTKYIAWGEERSDNFERSTGTSASGQIATIMNGNLLPTYTQFQWTPLYNAINYCNKVLAHGPETIERDQSFSESDWLPIKAEMVTLRAFAHFVLVRTFGEIPYVTVDYNNDSQELALPQSTQLEVLNNIIDDLESVKDIAMIDYGNTTWNKGRITKKAVYALLADVYLWRASYIAGNNQPFSKITLSKLYTGERSEAELKSRQEAYPTTAKADYEKCVEYCNLVINMARDEKIKKLKEKGETELTVSLLDMLEANESTGTSLVETSTVGAYRSIFGKKNSDESIFELQVQGTDSYKNGMIQSVFYNIGDSKDGWFVGAQSLFESALGDPNTTAPSTVFTKTDLRLWETFQYSKDGGSTSFSIGKYIRDQLSQNSKGKTYMEDNTSDKLEVDYNNRKANTCDANWIVYRLSEIYLMKAEAMSQIYEDEEEMQEAFSHVSAVFRRSNPFAYNKTNKNIAKDTLNFETFKAPTSLERLVMAERQREFICEGKRWFDLVRFAQRQGNNSEMLSILTRKYGSNADAIKAKLIDRQSLFSPINKDELKANTLLYQNSIWDVNETTARTDE